ncbi:MAG TPA: signal peptide peptidase SppA [Myxococcales bacterium]|jgi:protease-4
MRLLLTAVFNLFALLFGLLVAPLRLLDRKARWLVVEVSGELPWRAGRRRRWPWDRARRRPLAVSSIHTLAEQLRKAAQDRRVRGVVVKVEGFEGPGSQLWGVRAALAAFRQAGKEVVFYGRAVSMREYALMSDGSRSFLAPGGRIDLKGYAAELYVLGEALQKAGVKAHFLRRAEYKTAPELFTASQVSPAQKETTQALLEDAFARSVAAIAEGRKKTPEEVRAWIDQGPYGAAEALAKGLVDGIADGEELEEKLAEPEQEKARLVSLARYRGPSPFSGRFKRFLRPPKVGLVRVEGVIKLGESVRLPFAPQAAGSDTVVQALKLAREDDSIKAIVLAIDSRGGSSLASELVLRAVRRAAAQKPVVAYIDHIAASGGYMAAVGAPTIIASPSAITGSIGVFGGKFEISGLLDKLGVGRTVLALGEHAAMESGFQPWSEGERAALDREIEQTYRDFVGVVAEGRKRKAEEIEPLAGGRVYTATKAKEVGLIDELGGFEDAVAKAAGMAGLKKKPDVVLVEVPAKMLSALSGVKGLAGAAKLLMPLAEERVFAMDETWVRVRPKR